MVHWIVISLFSGITVLLVTLYFNLGGYKSVPIEIKDHPGFTVLYRLHVGPYHKIDPEISKVEKWAKENNIECLKPFGKYLDKPGTIEDSRLRSYAGCVINQKPDLPENSELKLEDIPPGKVIFATFEGAPSIGPMFVYPKIEKIVAEKKLTTEQASWEFYSTPGPKQSLTEYMFFIQ